LKGEGWYYWSMWLEWIKQGLLRKFLKINKKVEGKLEGLASDH
jgi:hypothetical protein